MFRLCDTFEEYDEKKRSYAFDLELSSDLPHLHSHTGPDGFYLDCPGNKYLLRTPKVHDFTLALSVRYTLLTNVDTDVRIHFGYDRRERTGYALELEWKLDGGVRIHLLRIADVRSTKLSTLDVGVTELREGCWYPITLRFADGAVQGSVSDLHFALALPAYERGRVGLQRGHFIGEWILQKLCLETDEEFPEETVREPRTAQIPLLFGGQVPYELTWSVQRIDGQAYLRVCLDGGTYAQRYNFPGQYGVEHNIFTGAYIRAGAQKWNLRGEQLYIVNQQIVWECLKGFFNAADLPLERCWRLDDEDFSDIAFGFAEASYSGYHLQAGGPWEFAYDREGQPVYSGAPAGTDWFELKSPADKQAVRMIPPQTVEYEKVVAHFQNNHYFAPDEPMALTFILHTDKRYLSVKARFCDVYGNFLEDVTLDDSLSCTLAPRPVGLYRIVYDVYHGEERLTTQEYVLEVFDPTGRTCAPLVSGLPFLYSTPNEQKALDADPFNPWSPTPSCNAEHFFACVCFTPVYARRRRTWEITRLFGREWYVWLSSRTVPGDCPKREDLPREPRWEDWTDIVDNCDYMFYQCLYGLYPLRNDYWNPRAYKSGLPKEVENFMKAYPDVQLSWTPGEPFEKEHMDELLMKYQDRFIPFANGRIRDLITAEQDVFRARNPRWKSAAYGPYSIYVAALTSYYLGNIFGRFMDDTLSKYMYSGFAQFEDYPHSCEYGTYRGTFATATIMLHCGGLRLYPEQYRSGGGGCIDGAVKHAHPPLGKRIMPDYYTVMQSWENVCNTPYRTPDGYRWWDTYGFMKRDNTGPELAHYVRGWGKILENRPAKPLSRTVFITDFCAADNRYDVDYVDHYGLSNIHNISEEGCAYLYEQSRLRGLPLPYVMKWETLACVEASETDVIVLPSLANAPDWAEAKLRALAEEGVGLIALSDVGGLADLFGIRPQVHTTRVCEAFYEGEREYITPFDAEFFAVPTDGEVLMTADGEPVIIRKGRCAYINAPVSEIGRESFFERIEYCEYTISELLARAVGDVLCALSRPAAVCDGAGLTLYEGADGVRRALLISYALTPTPVTLHFNGDPDGAAAVTDAVVAVGTQEAFVPARLNRFVSDGKLDAVRLTIPAKGWALLTLA